MYLRGHENKMKRAKICPRSMFLVCMLKAAYDTIIGNKVYDGMSELNFPTKLIRLTKATLTH
jgi:hypothetical protein